MKNIIDKNYFKISLYAIFTITISILVFRVSSLSDNIMPVVFDFINSVYSIFSAVLTGLIIAYLMTPATNFFERKLNNLFRTNSFKARSNIRKLSIFAVYIIFFGTLFLSVRYLIPQIIGNITTLFANIPGYAQSISLLLLDLEQQLIESWGPLPKSALDDFLDTIDINNFINLGIAYTNTIIEKLLSSTFSFIGLFFNAIISFFVALYALSQRETFANGCKRFVYAILKKDKADKVVSISTEAHQMMIKFFVGKSLDSIIIGIIAFVGLSLLNNPYALLLAFIIGICNMIPYFGPFIGAVPAIGITLFEGFFPALWVGLFILGLQQFDGNYLGPKIVGNSLGITPFWIIASVTIGGGIAGAVGMFLACPITAVILLVTNRWMDKTLDKKEIYLPKREAEEFLK